MPLNFRHRPTHDMAQAEAGTLKKIETSANRSCCSSTTVSSLSVSSYSSVIRANYNNTVNAEIQTLYRIGKDLYASEKYKEALQRFEEALAHGPDQKKKNHIRYEMGKIYFQMGNYKDAMKYLSKYVNIVDVGALGDEPVDVIPMMNNTAINHRDNGDTKSALELYLGALRIGSIIFGNDHDNVAMMNHNIGVLYCDTLEYKCALNHLKAALKVRQKNLGDHLDVMTSLYAIGRVQFETNQFDRALKYYQEGVRIEMSLYGTNYPNSASTLLLIGQILYQKREYNNAMRIWNNALRLRKNDPSRCTPHQEESSLLRRIGKIHIEQKDYRKALEIHQELLEVQKGILGKVHPDVASTLYIIGDIYLREKKYDTAIAYFKEELTVKQMALGNDHDEIAVVLHTIGSIYDKNMGDYKSAVKVLREALKIEKAQGDEEAVEKTKAKIARILFNCGHLDTAMRLSFKSNNSSR